MQDAVDDNNVKLGTQSTSHHLSGQPADQCRGLAKFSDQTYRVLVGDWADSIEFFTHRCESPQRDVGNGDKADIGVAPIGCSMVAVATAHIKHFAAWSIRHWHTSSNPRRTIHDIWTEKLSCIFCLGRQWTLRPRPYSFALYAAIPGPQVSATAERVNGLVRSVSRYQGG